MTHESNAQAKPAMDEAPETAEADLTQLAADLTKARDDLLRALADAENTRRRAERQVQEARIYAIDRFAADLLPVADTLSRALAAAPRESVDDGVRTLIAGIEMTERSMVEMFARHGLKRVGAKGDAFDPKVHQAVAQAPSDQPAGIVIEVMQPGYTLGDRTVRAAMVIVSGGAAGATQSIDITL